MTQTMVAATHPSNVISLPRPFEWQVKVLAENIPRAVIFSGRRSGKTQLGVYKILRYATSKIGLYWWVGLSWRSASLKRAWRLLKYYARKIWRAAGLDPIIREADKEITLPNGSSIWMRTSEKPDSLAGEAVTGVVVDEFSLMPEVVWTEYIEGTLLDTPGSWAMFIGVPKGNNWASKLWTKATIRLGWKQYHSTTYDNPHVRVEDIDELQKNLPKGLFDQEYLAIITDAGDRPFHGVMRACILPIGWAKYDPSHRYVFGIDWGKSKDWTVVSILDWTEHKQAALVRIKDIDWEIQLSRVLAILKEWSPYFGYVEMNGIGDMPFQSLQKQYRYAQPWYTTQDTKDLLVTGLALALEKAANNDATGVYFLNDPVLVNELDSYEMERLASGKWRYNAPLGEHDDTVIATGLSVQALYDYRRFGGINL